MTLLFGYMPNWPVRYITALPPELRPHAIRLTALRRRLPLKRKE